VTCLTGQVYWEYTISGTCAYVGVATPAYSIASCPGLGEESWAIGDSGFGAELLHNASLELDIDLSMERGPPTLPARRACLALCAAGRS
jgi:hypothetical protein